MEVMKKYTELEKTVSDNPISAMLGLIVLASMIDGAKAAQADGTGRFAPKKADIPATTVGQFKAIEDKARTDLYALMDKCFDDGSTVFLSDHQNGDVWSEGLDGKYRGRPHTVAIVRNVLGREYTGISALNPPDKFSVVIGRVIALRRAMDLTVPKEYYDAGSLLAKATANPISTVKAGDTIRILVDNPCEADLKAGDIAKVRRVLTPDGNVETVEGVPLFGIGWRIKASQYEVVTPEPTPAKSYKVGDKVKLIGKTRRPSDSASDVEVGKVYKVTGTTKYKAFGMCLHLDGRLCGWVHADDVEIAPEAKPEAITPRKTPKVGDRVKVLHKDIPPSTSSNAKIGGVYTVKNVGGKSIGLDIPYAPWVNVADIEVVEDAPTIKLGDYVRLKAKTIHPSDSSDAKIGGIYKVIFIYPNGNFKLDIRSCPNVNKIDVELVRFVKRTAKPGEVIRVTLDNAYGADVKEGDFFKVDSVDEGSTVYTGENVITGEGDGWYIPENYYEVVEAVNASQPTPTDEFKPGDKVTHKITRKVYTIKELVPCKLCGKPAASVEESDSTAHIDNLVKVKEEKPAEAKPVRTR